MALVKLLDLQAVPHRIECFDVSHTMGEAAVASCVVFIDGAPARREYRRFRITGIAPGDDLAALERALSGAGGASSPVSIRRRTCS